jgi:3-oxoacyl-[acyl-carrier-protein] synthase II
LDADLDLNIVANETRPAAVGTALSNSFGFGGTNASLVMRQFPATPRLQRTGDV